MTLTLIGVNHKTAPISLREKIAIGRDELAETTRALAATPGVSECMIVSTCNRVELLAAVKAQMCRWLDFCRTTSALMRQCWGLTCTSIATRRR